jgi:hypothetical protein
LDLWRIGALLILCIGLLSQSPQVSTVSRHHCMYPLVTLLLAQHSATTAIINYIIPPQYIFYLVVFLYAVGYGDVHPRTHSGKAFTIAYCIGTLLPSLIPRPQMLGLMCSCGVVGRGAVWCGVCGVVWVCSWVCVNDLCMEGTHEGAHPLHTTNTNPNTNHYLI